MSKTPRDVANEAEGKLIALPQRVLSLLLVLALDARETQGQVADQAREAISEAAEYLRQTFQADFRAAASTFSDKLAAAHQELSTVLAKFSQRLPQPEENGDPEIMCAMLDDVGKGLEPAVGGFLHAMFTDVVAHEKASARHANSIDASSLNHIEDIAKKINLIAINASVEAARAGEVGRGFGVIAKEIKELSQQSKTAVERIRSELT